MEANNQNLLQDAFYHIDKMKIKLTEKKLAIIRNRELDSFIEEQLKQYDLLEFILKNYDKHNVMLLCNIVNQSYSDPNSHGVTISINKKRFANNLDRGRMNYITFPI